MRLRSGVSRSHGAALDSLREYAKVRSLNGGGLEFTNDHGDGTYDLARLFRPVANSVEMSHERLHDARHTFATRFARTLGAALTMLRDALGRHTPAMVQRCVHEQMDAVAEALERMHGNA